MSMQPWEVAHELRNDKFRLREKVDRQAQLLDRALEAIEREVGRSRYTSELEMLALDIRVELMVR